MTRRSVGSRRVEFVVAFGPKLGLGHVVRCAALSQALRREGVSTALRGLHDAVPSSIRSAFDSVAAPDASGGARSDCVVIDLPPGHRSEGRSPGPVAVVDDGPPREVDADVVVNPNLMAEADGYRVRAGGVVLAGARHALLGDDVLDARARYTCPDGEVHRVLVTCGAADPVGVTERVLGALAPLASEVDLVVLVGALNPRGSRIKQLADEVGARALENASVVAEAVGSQLAVTTLGVTASELACIGVPNVAIAHSAIQVPHLVGYDRSGLVRGVGLISEVTDHDISSTVMNLMGSAADRRAVFMTARDLVDGQGAARTARTLLDHLGR